MADMGEDMGKVLSGTAPTAEMLREAVEARREQVTHASGAEAGEAAAEALRTAQATCNVPLQLGVGVKGGAEIAVGITRALLQQQPTWAIFSEDKTNGFNAISRAAIYRGLQMWFPELIPCFRQYYARRGCLYTVGPEGKRLAVDERGEPYWSAEGCTQGDPLGPFWFAVGYHESLLRTQAAHPSTTILCYLDDTYYGQEPGEGRCALLTGEQQATQRCGVLSNRGKQEVYGSAAADLSAMPASLRGSPWAAADEAKGYAGGRLKCIKVLGSFLGERDACAAKLVARVEDHLEPLMHAARLRDTRKHNTSMQVQLEILRYCANTSLVYFLRTMGVAATERAAATHDAAVARVWHQVVGTAQASPGERSRAERQARLPVRMGGCGLTAQAGIADAACVGSWALIWRPMQRLCPQHFACVEIELAPEPVFVELRAARARLMQAHKRTAAVYKQWDVNNYDYDTAGEGHARYHPDGLAEEKELLPLSQFGTDDEHLQHAQRKYSSVIHHAAWLKHLTVMQAISRREAVRFVAVSQRHAGTFLNAVPKHKAFCMPTWAMRLCLQRRLGLPLLAAAAAAGERRSRSGKLFDALGDVAVNDGESGHQTRHFLINNALFDAMRRVYGGQVRREPDNYQGYSDHRPDLALLLDGGLSVFDLKVFDPISSTPGKTGERGAYVGFGNTAGRARDVVLGRRQRGKKGDKAFNPRTGAGYVSPIGGDYARAQACGVTCVPLLVETFGGLSPALYGVLRAAAEWRSNKLSASEYDETTWAARSWMTFVAQRLSVAVQLSMAQEAAEALGLSVAADPRAA